MARVRARVKVRVRVKGHRLGDSRVRVMMMKALGLDVG